MANVLQGRPLWQRRLLFWGLMAVIVVLVLVIGGSVLVALVRNSPRLVPIVLDEAWRVREYAQLADADAYPATLAMAEDGTL